MLQIINVSKIYTNRQAGLLPISLEVGKGKCLAVVGESGSGKTTFLQILAGFLPTDSGEMCLDGERLPNPQTMLVRGYPDIQLVAQDFQLFPKHRIWENITLPIRHYPKQAQETRLAYLAEILGLENLLERYPRELSGGQQQRTAIARALANEPDFLLLDEPFNQADRQTKAQLEKAFLALRKEGETGIVLVTHEPAEALGLADKLLVLHKGKTLQFDSPTQIYEKPVNEYVAQLFGAINQVEKHIFVRAEHCIINPAPFQNGEGVYQSPLGVSEFLGNITQCLYQGHQYKITLQMNIGKEWLAYHPTPLRVGEETHFVSFQARHLLYF
jgi:iron(III) transport system ATP-binding protein